MLFGLLIHTGQSVLSPFTFAQNTMNASTDRVYIHSKLEPHLIPGLWFRIAFDKRAGLLRALHSRPALRSKVSLREVVFDWDRPTGLRAFDVSRDRIITILTTLVVFG